MKKYSPLLLSLLLLTACSEEKKQGNLEITGNVKGLKKGMLFLKKVGDSTLITIDSIKIDGDSRFATAIDLDEPQALYLFLDRGQTSSIDNSLMFFAEPGKMDIDTRLETFYAKAKVTGSKNHDLYEEYKAVRSRYISQQLDLTQKQLEALQKKADFTAEDQKKYESVIRRKYLYTVNFALTHKDREIAPYLMLSEVPDAATKLLDTVQKSMSPEVARSKYGKLLTEYVQQRKAEDMQAAN